MLLVSWDFVLKFASLSKMAIKLISFRNISNAKRLPTGSSRIRNHTRPLVVMPTMLAQLSIEAETSRATLKLWIAMCRLINGDLRGYWNLC